MNKTFGNIFKGDKVIWMVFFFLCIISIIEVYSASSQLTYKGGNYIAPVLKHISILVVGIFFMVVTLNIKCKYFRIALPLIHSWPSDQWSAQVGADHGHTVSAVGVGKRNNSIGSGTDSECHADG